jgi:hypothetical protein
MSCLFGGFDGNFQAIRIGTNIPSLNNVAGASIACWIRPRTIPPGPGPDSDKYSPMASSVGPPTGGLNGTSRIEIEVQSNDTGTLAHLNIVSHITDTDPSSTVSSADGTVLAGQTIHAVVTADFNARLANIYKNGVLIASGILVNGTAGNTSATNGKVGAIGSEDDSQPFSDAGEFFDGHIEDARLYSRVLTADEVQTLYECQGIDGIVFGLQQRYELQDNAANINVSNSSPADSAQQQLNGNVPPGNGSPTYQESIAPTYRRRLA